MKQLSIKIVKIVVLLLLISAATDTLLTPYVSQQEVEMANSLIPEESRPKSGFFHDGCTLFPDQLPWADYREACLQHNIKYWAGGTEEERLQADLEFKEAIAHTTTLGRPTSLIAYYEVRLFGNSFLTKFYGANWGYGWSD